jgi:mannitol-1-/sugar-/sorbitol-6-phosphatase
MTFTCHAIIFDLDGVLVDSQAITERHLRSWADRHGVALAELLALHHGRTTAETLRAVAPHLDAEHEAQMLESGEAGDLHGLAAFPGASRLIAELAEHPWAIATSCKRETACSRLQHLGLACPRVLITAEDVTNGKPSPEPYVLAARRLGLPPSACVVIEDAPAGVASARAAGARVIAVASSLPAADLGAADVIIRQLEDMSIERVAQVLTLSFRTGEAPTSR